MSELEDYRLTALRKRINDSMRIAKLEDENARLREQAEQAKRDAETWETEVHRLNEWIGTAVRVAVTESLHLVCCHDVNMVGEWRFLQRVKRPVHGKVFAVWESSTDPRLMGAFPTIHHAINAYEQVKGESDGHTA